MPRPTPLQDRQARGQPPPPRHPPRPTHRAFGNPPVPSAGPSASTRTAPHEAPALAYAEQQRIDAAARVLSSWEALAMHASAASEVRSPPLLAARGGRGDGVLIECCEQSIPQTRLRFEKKLLGIEDEGSEEWEDEVDEPWVEEGLVQAGGKAAGSSAGKVVAGEKKGEQKEEKNGEKGKASPRKGGRGERRESGGRREEGTFAKLRREREERRRER
ncbi:hypothetical protein MMC18_002485 [Xylographa bjoerkii]|nr:hypothetical protein [Xylographa bjoerkii]